MRSEWLGLNDFICFYEGVQLKFKSQNPMVLVLPRMEWVKNFDTNFTNYHKLYSILKLNYTNHISFKKFVKLLHSSFRVN